MGILIDGDTRRYIRWNSVKCLTVIVEWWFAGPELSFGSIFDGGTREYIRWNSEIFCKYPATIGGYRIGSPRERPERTIRVVEGFQPTVRAAAGVGHDITYDLTLVRGTHRSKNRKAARKPECSSGLLLLAQHLNIIRLDKKPNPSRSRRTWWLSSSRLTGSTTRGGHACPECRTALCHAANVSAHPCASEEARWQTAGSNGSSPTGDRRVQRP